MRALSLGTRWPPTRSVSPRSPRRVYTRVMRIAIGSRLLEERLDPGRRRRHPGQGEVLLDVGAPAHADEGARHAGGGARELERPLRPGGQAGEDVLDPLRETAGELALENGGARDDGRA